MAFHVRDKETDALVRRLASERGVGLTEAVKQAVAGELARSPKAIAEKMARIQEVRDRAARWPNTGPVADKAFLDALSGND